MPNLCFAIQCFAIQCFAQRRWDSPKSWRQLGQPQIRGLIWLLGQRTLRKPWQWWKPQESGVQRTGSPTRRTRRVTKTPRLLKKFEELRLYKAILGIMGSAELKWPLVIYIYIYAYIYMHFFFCGRGGFCKGEGGQPWKTLRPREMAMWKPCDADSALHLPYLSFLKAISFSALRFSRPVCLACLNQCLVCQKRGGLKESSNLMVWYANPWAFFGQIFGWEHQTHWCVSTSPPRRRAKPTLNGRSMDAKQR